VVDGGCPWCIRRALVLCSSCCCTVDVSLPLGQGKLRHGPAPFPVRARHHTSPSRSARRPWAPTQSERRLHDDTNRPPSTQGSLLGETCGLSPSCSGQCLCCEPSAHDPARRSVAGKSLKRRNSRPSTARISTLPIYGTIGEKRRSAPYPSLSACSGRDRHMRTRARFSQRP